jgi:hypothetical protein
MTRALVLAAVALIASPAAAAPPERVIGLLDVRADGVDEPVASRFAEAVEEGLQGLGDYVAAPRSRMKEMLAASAWSSACTAGPCLEEVGEQTGAQFVVIAGLAGSGMSYRYTLTLLDTSDGAILRQVSESCPACTVEDLASQATLATIGLVTGAEGSEMRAPVVDEEPMRALQERVGRHERMVRRTGVLLVGVAVVSAAVGYYMLDKDRDDVSYPLLGAAGGLAASGVVMLGLSLRF